MNKLVLALAAICMLSVGNADAFLGMGCNKGKCAKKAKCEKPVERCAPKPKCVKRCVVEKCVEPKKVCETNCYYECPDDCETAGSEYKPMHKDVTRRGMKRSHSQMNMNEGY